MESWPQTVDEVVICLLADLSETEKTVIRDKGREELWQLHFALGLNIRNRFGLNSGNVELIKSCTRYLRSDDPVPCLVFHEDDASRVILEALRDELRREW